MEKAKQQQQQKNPQGKIFCLLFISMHLLCFTFSFSYVSRKDPPSAHDTEACKINQAANVYWFHTVLLCPVSVVWVFRTGTTGYNRVETCKIKMNPHADFCISVWHMDVGEEAEVSEKK